MKPLQKLLVLGIGVCLTAAVNPARAITPVNTDITNQAFVTYKDANNNDLNGQSNIVHTIVTQVGAVSLTPTPQTATISPSGTTVYNLTVTNDGNGPDTFNLAPSNVSAGWTVVLFKDADADGTPDAGEIITGTPSLAGATASTAGESYSFSVQVTAPNSTDGVNDQFNVTATSAFDGTKTSVASLTTTISAAVVGFTKSVSPANPSVGDTITYTLSFTNTGSVVAASSVITDTLPAGITYVGSPAAGATYNAGTRVLTIPVGNIAANGGSGSVTFTATVNANAGGQTITNSAALDFTSSGQPRQVTADNTNAVISVPNTYGVVLTELNPTTRTVAPGGTASYHFTVENTGSATETIDLTQTTTLTGLTYCLDADVNGACDGATFTNIVLTSGQTVTILVTGTVPAGTADGATLPLNITGSVNGQTGVSDTAAFTTTTTAPVVAVVKAVSNDGTNFGTNTTATPGTTLTYRLTVTNNGSDTAKSVSLSDVINSNTTFQAGSVQIGGVAAGGAASFDGATRTLTINLGDLNTAASRVVTFQVVVN